MSDERFRPEGRRPRDPLPPTDPVDLDRLFPTTGAIPVVNPDPRTSSVPAPTRSRRAASGRSTAAPTAPRAPAPATGALPADATRGIALRGAGTGRRAGKRLRVDWPACKAHGLCHELLPEAIGLDEWGFPVVAAKPLRGARLDDAKRAVAACPTLALRLVDIP